nr:MAG TPA: hypothetical protein [Microviridae sp.]
MSKRVQKWINSSRKRVQTNIKNISGKWLD